MATDAQLTQIVRALNTVKTVGAARAAGNRAYNDTVAAASMLGLRASVGGGDAQRRALANAGVSIQRELAAFAGAPDGQAVGGSWSSLRSAINKAYVEIAGAEALASASANTPLDVAAINKILGDSAQWWVSYGSELAKEPNVIARAGKVVGGAVGVGIHAAANITKPILHEASGLVTGVLGSVWPLLLIGGVVLVVVVVVAVKVK
ncbi:MAG: hypothetical protein PHR30_18495 [Gallionellaceae bacterium]|nr:hypothetical protein [Gallionellaceae bacterium]